jgi:parvulin-like peptidyl-prolyl isomerase
VRGTPPGAPRRPRGGGESKSATVRAAAAAPSRRQVSKWEREQRQQRMLYLGGGALVLLVLLIFGGGVFYDNVVRANEAVAQVGSQNITTGQLLDEVKPNTRVLETQAKRSNPGASSTGLSQYIDTQKRSLPDQALNELLDATIIQQEANRRGLSVTPAEVNDRMQQLLAGYQASSNPTPVSAAGDASPTAAPTPAAGTTPTPLPTLQPADYSAALAKLTDETGLTEADERQAVTRDLLRQKVEDAVGQEQVPSNQEQVHARHIVLPSEDQARDVLSQLQAGADFASLAQQDSTDTATKDSGGDMGWFARGSKPQAIEDAAFGLQPGQTSDVVPNGSSFEIIQVVERQADRPVPADQLTLQRSQAFNTWLSSQRSGPDVKLTFSPAQRDWILSKIGVRP